MNLVLVAVAAVAGDATAVALTAVSVVVATGAAFVYLHESALDQERIAHLSMAIPTLAALDTSAALNLAPKPSPVMTEVLKHAAPTIATGASAPIPITRVPIDRD